MRACLGMMLVAATLAATTTATNAQDAALKRDVTICGTSTDWDSRIAACSRLLQRKNFTTAVISAVHHARGQGYLQKGQIPQALADFNLALKHNPRSALILGDRSKAHMDGGDPDRALADVNRALEIDPNNLVALVNRSAIFVIRQEYDRALSDLDKAIRLHPNTAIAYANRAEVYFNRLQTDLAIRDAERALQLDPKLAGAYNALGVAYSQRAEYDRAIANFDQAIRLDPGSVAAHGNRGIAWFGKGQYDRALADYDAAIRLNPKERGAYSGRCSLKSQMNLDLDEALADCEMAVKLSSVENTNAFSNRGEIRFRKGEYDKAISDFDKAIEIDPRNAGSIALRAETWRAKGDYTRAIAGFSEAIAVNPKVAATYVYRGLTLEAQGQTERAVADFKEALRLPAIVHIAGRSGSYQQSSRREQETARARLALLSDTPSPRASSAPPKPAANTPSAMTETGRRTALVIGNGAYVGTSPLANPANDARTIARNLRQMNFEVSEGTDVDRDAMKKLVGDFLRGAVGARIAVLFYAGHGIQIEGRNFLLPIDARLDGASLTADMIEVDQMLAGLDDRIRTNIVVLDACRDNPMANKVSNAASTRSANVRSGLAAPSGLGAGATLGAGTLLAFATAPGQVALDGDGENSPFSAALARHIGTPGLEVQQMLTRVRAEVVAATRNTQVPWSNSSLLGEVYLVAGKP